MAVKTEKQREQWRKFNLLGTLVGTACWIRSKHTIITSAPELSVIRKEQLINAIMRLNMLLLLAAQEAGWKPKK